MKQISVFLVSILAASTYSATLKSRAAETQQSNSAAQTLIADTVYTNRKIYTVAPAQPWAEAIAIKGDKFVRVGSSKEISETTGEPSGTVHEFGMGAVEQVLLTTPAQQYAPSLAEVSREFNKYGFTTVKAAEGPRAWVEGARLLEERGELTFRIFLAWDWALSHYLTSSVEEADKNIENWPT